MASPLIDDLEPVPASEVKKRGWRDERVEALEQAFRTRLAALRTRQGERELREALDRPLEFDEAGTGR